MFLCFCCVGLVCVLPFFSFHSSFCQIFDSGIVSFSSSVLLFFLLFLFSLTPEEVLDCLRDLLRANLAQNYQIVVEVASKYSDLLQHKRVLSLFDDFKSPHLIYYYLGKFVNQTEDPDLIFKFIDACVKLNSMQEVERICRENNFYNPVQVKVGG